jgi:RHS repeat-associated protein
LLQLTDYYTTTTAGETTSGGVAGYFHDQNLQRGQLGTAVPQLSMQYFAHTGGGATVYPAATTTVYRNSDGTGAEVTSAGYTWYAGTTRMQSMTVTQPVIAAAQNGPGTPDTTTSAFDPYGRVVRRTDPDGFVTTYQYDVATGAMTQMIQDAGGTGHLNLTTALVVDGLGRTTQRTDPNGNVTYTVYNDPNHEVRTYPGWQGAVPTGPTQVMREDRGHTPSYVETLTMAAAPHLTGGRPDGSEAIANLQTLSRTFTSPGGQVIETDAYFNLAGLTYSTNPTLGTAGQVQPDGTVTGNYWPTVYGYDTRGRLNRTVSPTGTIRLTTYDGLSRVVSQSVGTSDANMVVVSQNVYDGGGVGDGNRTQITLSPGGGADPRVTQNFFDWRNRLVASKAGVQDTEDTTTHRPITYTEFDNLNQAIAQEQYDGDGLTVSIGPDGVPVKPPATVLRARSTTEYDDQGRVFRTHVYSVDQTNGTVSTTSLTTNTWYDHRGNIIKTAAPGGLVTKMQYDGAGRVVTSYTTDGAGDTSWADASRVANNHVLSQTETTYDNNGNVILGVTRDRFHDESATGALNNPTTSPRARVSFVASYYDKANRLTATVDVGTNGGTAYTRPANPPARSDIVLVTSQTYDDHGWVLDVTDPRGITTRTLYDNLGRKTKIIAAFTGGQETSSSDVPSDATYDGAGHVLTMTAELPGGGVQKTQYVYGVTPAGGSALSSNDLLAAIIYADNGQPHTDSYTYNALGQPLTKADRNGTLHTYSYDVLSRLTADDVTGNLGVGVDGQVQRLETAYDTGGRPFLYTSKDGLGNVVNQVQQVYNGLGQLITEYQAHYGPVDPSSTPAVQYTYSQMAGGANHSRLVSMTYPNGRVLHYGYNSGLDDAISRLSFLADDDGAGGIGTHLEEYSYLGLSTVVLRAHPEAGVDLSAIKLTGEPNGDAGDQYTGLDRFGRVVDQRWLHEAGGSATDRFQYSYDRDGNRLGRANLVNAAFSEQFGYDTLNRLTTFTRGSHTQSWDLDALGNWNRVTTDGTPQTRTHNSQNQISSISPPSTTPAYDNNGNTTTDDQGTGYVYDAWNRLVRAQDSGGNPLAAYSYDALGRRVQEVENNAFGNPVTRDLFFSSQWQVLEEWETDTSGNTLVRAQTVWSPVYVDALVERDRDPAPGGSGSLSERLYVQQDANWNVTALVDTTGTVQERYVYDPYGQRTVLDPVSWQALNGSQFGWVYLYQGGRLDQATGLYDFRHREYSPTLGRWMQQDPTMFMDGMNVYEAYFVVNWLDPMGLAVTLSYTTVSGPTYTPCGGFSWVISWKLTGADAKTTGYIVQKIQMDVDKTMCDGTDASFHTTYWEGWPVRRGKVDYSDPVFREEDRPIDDSYDDAFSLPDNPDSFGKSKFKGWAKFEFNWVPPPGMTAGKVPEAGILPSTPAKPPGWDDSGALVRIIGTKWFCCWWFRFSSHAMASLVTASAVMSPEEWGQHYKDCWRPNQGFGR